ncbi:hypothetical protein GCM10010328_58880 [Streptomyces rubiginosohelvolus]|uniref:Uncharacterized protein n=1 Tax=Streptomyces rubiginosohelvolus TaxID=67362 RepID=A0ABQ3CC25_9ACTN|nr:hypothetical protein GCM10010328_58880 [Streptomyces pluricolorescens]
MVDVGGEVHDAIMAHEWHHVEPTWHRASQNPSYLQERNEQMGGGAIGTLTRARDGTTPMPDDTPGAPPRHNPTRPPGRFASGDHEGGWLPNDNIPDRMR